MKKVKFIAAALASLLAVGGLSSFALGSDAEARGLAIAKQTEAYANGFGDFTVDMKMVLRNRQGQESTRVMKSKTLEVKGDGDKALVVFDHPRDISGTALLTFTHRSDSDDQWLYLPALKRVKRISSTNKSGPFVGSEFAYEDVASQEVEKYRHKYLRREKYRNLDCHVVEQTPVDKDSGYKRRVVWIDEKEFRPLKVEFFDRRNEHVKTLENRGFAKFLDHQWRPSEMAMVNHQTGKSTSIFLANYKFHQGLDSADFNQNSLRRAR